MLAVKLLTLFPVLALGQYGAPASTTSPAASSTAGTAPASVPLFDQSLPC